MRALLSEVSALWQRRSRAPTLLGAPGFLELFCRLRHAASDNEGRCVSVPTRCGSDEEGTVS